MKLLTKLYQLNNPSYKEKKMSTAVSTILRSYGIKHNRTKKGIIYNLKKDTPLISCHMDSVFDEAPTAVVWKKGYCYGIDRNYKFTGLGADDKNGIWIAIKLLKKHRNNISFIFSVQEEAGSRPLEDLVWKHHKELERCKYGIVLDRRGTSDIIGWGNDYCDKPFMHDVCKLGKRYGYKEAYGLWSDANILNENINVVNLSVGYFNPHTVSEYVSLRALKNAGNFADAILTNINKAYGIPGVAQYDDFYGGSYVYSRKKKKKKDKDKNNSTLQEAIESGLVCVGCGSMWFYQQDIEPIINYNDSYCPWCGDSCEVYSKYSNCR